MTSQRRSRSSATNSRHGSWPTRRACTAAATTLSRSASPPRSQPRTRACWCSARRRLTSPKSARVTSRRVGDGVRVGGRAHAGTTAAGACGGLGAGGHAAGAGRGTSGSGVALSVVVTAGACTGAAAGLPAASSQTRCTSANTTGRIRNAGSVPWATSRAVATAYSSSVTGSSSEGGGGAVGMGSSSCPSRVEAPVGPRPAGSGSCLPSWKG